MAARRKKPDDPAEIIGRRVVVLLHDGLPERAIDVIRQYAHEVVEDCQRRDETPIDDWSILDDSMGLRERLRAILSDTAYTTIGRCNRATDAELLAIRRIGPDLLLELREAVAAILASHAEYHD